MSDHIHFPSDVEQQREITRLRAENESLREEAGTAHDSFYTELSDMRAQRDDWKRKAEAVAGNLKDTITESRQIRECLERELAEFRRVAESK